MNVSQDYTVLRMKSQELIYPPFDPFQNKSHNQRLMTSLAAKRVDDVSTQCLPGENDRTFAIDSGAGPIVKCRA